MKYRIFILFLVSCFFCYSQKKVPIEIVSVSKYHFKVKNISDSKIEFILENKSKPKRNEPRVYTLVPGEFEVFLKHDYKKKNEASINILNSDFDDVRVWDSNKMSRKGDQITHKTNFLIGIMLTKSDFNDFWEASGSNKLQWHFHYSLALLPETRFSDNFYTRFFISADYERISHNLSHNEPVFLGRDYINNPSSDFYAINNKEIVSLNFQYASVGLFNRFTFLNFGHIDLGFRIPVIKRDFIDFNEDEVQFSPRGDVVDDKLRNHITYDDSIINNTIYYVRFGITKNRGKYYDKMHKTMTYGIGFNFMNPQVEASDSFPLFYENQDSNTNQITSIPLSRDGFYYMMNFFVSWNF